MKKNKEIVENVFQLVSDSELDSALKLVRDWAEQNGYAHLNVNILMPVMNLFSYPPNDKHTLAIGYVATRFAEAVIAMVKQHTGRDTSSRLRRTVILGNCEDDFHALGRKIIASLLRSFGWTIHDLGNDVPAEDFVNAAMEHNAKVIGVSALMYTTAKNIVKIRKLLDERDLSGKIKLAVGGAVFIQRPELVEIVGGDGTAKSADYVPELFDKLWKEAVKNAR